MYMSPLVGTSLRPFCMAISPYRNPALMCCQAVLGTTAPVDVDRGHRGFLRFYRPDTQDSHLQNSSYESYPLSNPLLHVESLSTLLPFPLRAT